MQTLSSTPYSFSSMTVPQFAGRHAKNAQRAPRYASLALAGIVAPFVLTADTGRPNPPDVFLSSADRTSKAANEQGLNLPDMTIEQVLGFGPHVREPHEWTSEQVKTMTTLFQQNADAYLQLIGKKSGVSDAGLYLDKAFADFSEVDTRRTVNAFQSLLDTKKNSERMEIMNDWLHDVLGPHLEVVAGPEQTAKILQASTEEYSKDSSGFGFMGLMLSELALITLGLGGVGVVMASQYGLGRRRDASPTSLEVPNGVRSRFEVSA